MICYCECGTRLVKMPTRLLECPKCDGHYTGPDLRKVEFLPAPDLKPGQQRLRIKD